MKNEYPLIENKDPVIENRDPLIENKNPLIANRDSLIENEDPVMENKDPLRFFIFNHWVFVCNQRVLGPRFLGLHFPNNPPNELHKNLWKLGHYLN